MYKISQAPHELHIYIFFNVHIVWSRLKNSLLTSHKQSVNHIHPVVQHLQPDCSAFIKTFATCVFFFSFLTPLPRSSHPRTLRCDRAPPTACTSRRATRSTAPSAAATCTRRATGWCSNKFSPLLVCVFGYNLPEASFKGMCCCCVEGFTRPLRLVQAFSHSDWLLQLLRGGDGARQTLPLQT